MNEIDMPVEGDTDNEKARSRVRAMLEAGLFIHALTDTELLVFELA